MFSSIWDSFLSQASLLLLFQYVATLSRGKGHDLFLQSEFPYSRISLSFSRNWLGLDNFCEISLQNLRKFGSYFVFRQFLKSIWGTCSMLKCCDTKFAIPSIEKNGRGQLMLFYTTHYVNTKIYYNFLFRCHVTNQTFLMWIFFMPLWRTMKNSGQEGRRQEDRL